MERISEKLLVITSKITTQRHLSAIKNAFTALLPIVIAGAFCTLFASVVCDPTTTGLSLAKLPGMSWLSKLMPMFTAANYATMNFLTIGLVIILAIEFGEQFGFTKDPIIPVIAIASYVTLCTTSASTTVGDEVVTIANVLPREFTNAQGLFLGMLAALVSVELYCRLVNSKKLVIKMPDSVPPNVSKSFSVMIPAIVTILAVSGFGLLFQMVTSYTLADAIAMLIQKPLQNVLTGLPGYLIIFGLASVFWTLGIHGTNLLKPVYSATLLQASAANVEAIAAGTAPKFILNQAFATVFTTIGGTGCLAGLLIAILLFSKRDDYRQIANLSIIPGCFNICETLIFGVPIVLNPIMVVPFILAPMVSACIGYFLTVVGFCPVMVYQVPWTTPPLIIAWLSSGGSIAAVITQLLSLLAAFAIYTPFVFIANKQYEKEQEQKAKLAEEAAA